MIVRILAAGLMREVEVRRVDAEFAVTLDGRTYAVNVNRSGEAWSLVIGTRSHDVAMTDASDGTTIVQVDGRSVRLSVERGRGPGTRGAAAGSAADRAGPQRIVAPMPGKVIKVLVKPGDAVQPRQGLVVVEAMKMENELRATSVGTVSDIRVAEGSSVEAGAVLLILD